MNVLPTKLPTFKTPRLTIRPFKLDDAPVVGALANDKEIATNTENLPYPYDEILATEWISAHAALLVESKLLTLAIVNTKKDCVIGAIGLEINPKNDHAELGYWLGRPYWGQGYATEAAKRLLHYAFTEIKLHRVHSRHLTQNLASGNVLKKLGMRYEGRLRQHIQKWGVYEDLDVYGILKDEYCP